MAFARKNKGTLRKARRAQDKKQMNYARQSRDFLSDYRRTLPKTFETFQALRKQYPCRQFQFMLMDIQSMMDHIDDLKKNGPKPELAEKPLEESEMPITDQDVPAGMRVEDMEAAGSEPSNENENQEPAGDN